MIVLSMVAIDTLSTKSPYLNLKSIKKYYVSFICMGDFSCPQSNRPIFGADLKTIQMLFASALPDSI